MVLREIIDYNTKKWDFRSIIEDYLDCGPLEKLHEIVQYDVFVRENDQSSVFHKKFYENCDIDSRFDDLYKDFIKNFVSSFLEDENLVYQHRPSLRVHLNHNKAVGEFHKDSDYNHPIEEVNFFVPMTVSSETSTIWVESEPNKRDFRPINLKYGEIFVFSGGVLNHGNLINQTEQTRVSFDYRVIKSKNYKENDFKSVNSSRKFIIGEYYDKL